MELRSSVKWLILVLLTNLLVATVNPVSGVGYGEDSDALGQFVDDFTDLGNVSVAIDVVRNTTLDVMELNYSAVLGGGVENLTAWTEVDVPGDLTVNSTFVEFTSLRRDSPALIYRDFGAGYFDDFMYNFTHVFSSNEAGDDSNVAEYWPVALGNSATKAGLVASQMVAVEMGQLGPTDNRARYRLLQRKAGAWTIAILDDTYYSPFTHYCSLYRVGANLTLNIYSDVGRTVLLEHLSSLGADLDGYQYVHASIGYNSPGDPDDHATGYIGMIDLGEPLAGYYPDGYLTTEDYLDQVNGSTLALMIQSRIFPNTHITVQMSDDNATWGDAEGVAGDSHALDGGLETIDLRPFNGSGPYYIMYNLTTTDTTKTPFLNQSRLITTEGPARAGATTTVDGVNWLPIALILGLAMVLLASKTKG